MTWTKADAAFRYNRHRRRRHGLGCLVATGPPRTARPRARAVRSRAHDGFVARARTGSSGSPISNIQATSRFSAALTSCGARPSGTASEQLLFRHGRARRRPSGRPRRRRFIAGLPGARAGARGPRWRRDRRGAFPGYRLPADYVAVYQPDAGFVASERAIMAACGARIAAGAEIHARETVWRSSRRAAASSCRRIGRAMRRDR